MAGLTKNKANSAQLGLAGAWAELGNMGFGHFLVDLSHCAVWPGIQTTCSR